ncbi:type VII secretion system-associated protein [Micromonospora sp. KLBMP9576]|uniref:type VII secretion system-associated protein n=1 Tax=Micromonospora sp. KLBMP9576 TaxID=3424769 RepID=UPI003D8A0EBC
MTDSGAEAQWLVLLDADWADDTGGQPPAQAMVGGWPLRPDGTALPFQPNPDYRPASPGSATDLVDAAARTVVAGRAGGETVLWALRDSVQWLAVDQDGVPVVDAAPDGVPCVLVTTSGVHRDRIAGPAWREVTGAQLAGALPAGTDVLINLDGPAGMRLAGDVVRDALAGHAADQRM